MSFLLIMFLLSSIHGTKTEKQAEVPDNVIYS